MIVNEIRIRPEAHALWYSSMAPGISVPAFCIHCRRCVSYSSSKAMESRFRDFPIDVSDAVCPTGALSWNKSLSIPEIRHLECVLCGACLSECPVKALFIRDGKVEVALDKSSSDIQFTQTEAMIVKGQYAEPSEHLSSLMHDRMRDGKGISFNPNLLVRNLLIALGWQGASYKEGVQYSSMDVLGWKDGIHLAAEVELDSQMIDIPRNLVAYLPLLVERHHWPIEETRLLGVGLSLPRKREEYWNVVEDVRHALGLKINTVSILHLVWRVLLRSPFTLKANEFHFSAADSSRQNHEVLEKIRPGYLGIFEPFK